MKKLAFLFGAALIVGCGGVPPQIVRFDTRPEAPFRGDSVLLEWVVRGADHVTLDGSPVPDSGSMKVLLDRSKDFTLKATAPRAESTKKLEIVASPK
ncbi:MAG: hypothetical protein Q8916_04850 [Bacteroidota bacterium]|nr:hypothetical protein [Bacteroidota bacterium]MDP4229716.1 hypothetical protein [Bacteroidota bacterium]MDP4236986.1 hypothetical protein [Bacteroidota bacterium]